MSSPESMRYQKERLQTLIMEYEAKNPGFEQGKKFVFSLLVVIVSLSIIDALCNIIYYVVLNGMSIGPEHLGPLIFPTAASLILARLFYVTGKKVFACILLVLVAYWLYLNAPLAAMIPGNLSNPGIPFYSFLLFWGAFKAIANIVQIAALLFILVNKKCKVFLGASAQMHKQLINGSDKFIV